MKRTKLLAILLVCAMLIAALSGCTQTAGAPSDSAISVTDMMDREINLSAPAKSIVALTAADCEIIYSLGAGELIVGRGEYCDYPAEVLEITSVQSGYETNVEQIIALAPEVLITSSMNQPKEQLDQLEQAGITVVVSNADDIAGTYESISLIGEVTGKTSEADALIAKMQSDFEEIAKAAGEHDEKTVYFEVSPLEYGLWTAGANTFMNEIADMLGLVNCFADVDGWAEISEEQVIERNPDLIVTISMYYGEGPTPEEEILARAGWENVTAVKDGAILNLQNNELSRPSARLVDGARMLYDFAFGAE